MMRKTIISLHGLIHHAFTRMQDASNTYRTTYLTAKGRLKPCPNLKNKTLKKMEDKMFQWKTSLCAMIHITSAPARETWGLLHLLHLLHTVEIGTMDKTLHSGPRSNQCSLDARVIRTLVVLAEASTVLHAFNL
jgi:hypothetical protein